MRTGRIGPPEYVETAPLVNKPCVVSAADAKATYARRKTLHLVPKLTDAPPWRLGTQARAFTMSDGAVEVVPPAPRVISVRTRDGQAICKVEITGLATMRLGDVGKEERAALDLRELELANAWLDAHHDGWRVDLGLAEGAMGDPVAVLARFHSLADTEVWAYTWIALDGDGDTWMHRDSTKRYTQRPVDRFPGEPPVVPAAFQVVVTRRAEQGHETIDGDRWSGNAAKREARGALRGQRSKGRVTEVRRREAEAEAAVSA